MNKRDTQIKIEESASPIVNEEVVPTTGNAVSGTPAHTALDEVVLKRRSDLDDLLSNTFNAVLRVEEKSLQNKLTEGLTITEIHTLVAVGLYETNPMNVVAARLGVTLATLTTAVNRLVKKGFVNRERSNEDRRKVMICLTKRGRQVVRVHDMFHKRMLNEALTDLNEQEEEVLARALGKVKNFFEENASKL